MLLRLIHLFVVFSFASCRSSGIEFEKIRSDYSSFYASNIVRQEDSLTMLLKDNYGVVILQDKKSSIRGFLDKVPHGHNFRFKDDNLEEYRYDVGVLQWCYEIKFQGSSIREIKGTPHVVTTKSQTSDSILLFFSTFMYDSIGVSLRIQDRMVPISLKGANWMPYLVFCGYLPEADTTRINIACFEDGKVVRTYTSDIANKEAHSL